MPRCVRCRDSEVGGCSSRRAGRSIVQPSGDVCDRSHAVRRRATQLSPGRARQAFDDGDYEHLDKILEHAVALIDTPQHRLELARAVLVQRDAGRVDPKVAAAAVMDLNQPRSMLLMSALAQSIAVANGNNATPSGLPTPAR